MLPTEGEGKPEPKPEEKTEETTSSMTSPTSSETLSTKEEKPENPKDEETTETPKKNQQGFVDIRPTQANFDLSVASCLYSFTDPEILDGKNAYQCMNCTKKRLVFFQVEKFF